MFSIPDLEVRETKVKGRGVFATKDIPAGVVVAVYLGRVILDNDFSEIEYGLYDMTFNDEVSILADKDKPGAHTLNQSCEPNCDSYSFKGYVLIFALRKIFAGEELTYCYNLGPPTPKRCSPCQHICHCGSDFCRGTLHTSETEFKKLDEIVSPEEQEYLKNPPVGVGEELPVLTDYPKIISADPKIYNQIFGYNQQLPLVLENDKLPEFSEVYDQIKNSGLKLSLPKLNLIVEGLWGDHLIIKYGNNR